METTNINGKIGLNNLYKFRTDRFLTKELKSRLIKMLEETTFIQNPCSNTPADFLKNLESIINQKIKQTFINLIMTLRYC